MKKYLVLIFVLAIFVVRPVHAAVDSDHDGLPDEVEKALGTNPYNPDTDGDGYLDGMEVMHGYNPLVGGANRAVKRKAEVDLAKQRMDLFMNGVKVAELPVSTGKKNLPTPTGTFSIIRKRPVVHYKGPGYDYPNTKWNLEFAKGYYIHSAYWHNEFGIMPVSHGCVNLAYKDMEPLYSFMSVGDPVKIYGKAPEQPLVLSKK